MTFNYPLNTIDYVGTPPERRILTLFKKRKNFGLAKISSSVFCNMVADRIRASFV